MSVTGVLLLVVELQFDVILPVISRLRAHIVTSSVVCRVKDCTSDGECVREGA
jgi:hypothetical protein